MMANIRSISAENDCKLLIKRSVTYRDPNRIVELEGENYVRVIVQSFNCIFQIIDGKNDQGNDAYIEFAANNTATNFGFFAEIKSGVSYKDKSGYKIPANEAHLVYWNKGLYPMLGIVYDPDLKKAFWADIKTYITEYPEILKQKTHSIRVSPEQEFATQTFPFIRDNFVAQINEFRSLQNFGNGLELFASIETLIPVMRVLSLYTLIIGIEALPGFIFFQPLLK